METSKKIFSAPASRISRGNSSSTAQAPATGMSSVRSRLSDQGISDQASELIMSSWRPATQKLYNVYISRWIEYAKANNISV